MLDYRLCGERHIPEVKNKARKDALKDPNRSRNEYDTHLQTGT